MLECGIAIGPENLGRGHVKRRSGGGAAGGGSTSLSSFESVLSAEPPGRGNGRGGGCPPPSSSSTTSTSTSSCSGGSANKLKEASSRGGPSWVVRVIQHSWFDRFILGAILLNCVFLALAPPSDQPEPLYLTMADAIFTAIFTVEMILKFAGLGIRGYFQDLWNWLDFVVVMESLTGYMFGGSLGLSFLKTVRTVLSSGHPLS
jgi:hypothetical protein